MIDPVTVIPEDEFNRELVGYTHPPDWVNPEPAGEYNLVVIGAGTAGLVTAVGAATVGARVALVENYLMGGDCLNSGCVPSKAIIRSSRVVADIRSAPEFGIHVTGEPEVEGVVLIPVTGADLGSGLSGVGFFQKLMTYLGLAFLGMAFVFHGMKSKFRD